MKHEVLTQPLRDADIAEHRRLQHFQIDQIGVASILDVVGLRNFHIANVTGLEVECPRAVGSVICCESGLSSYEKAPFVRRRVPMHFAHGSGFHSDDGCGETVGDRECFRVDNLITRQILSRDFVVGSQLSNLLLYSHQELRMASACWSDTSK